MKTGIIFGTFDLLHLGQIVMLEAAKRQCDYLIVALKSYRGGVNSEVHIASQTLVERYIKLEGCQYVDEIIPYETDQDIIDILQTMPVDICFAGEAAEPEFVGTSFCVDQGIQLQFNDKRHRFSSEALRMIVYQKEAAKTALGKSAFLNHSST